MRRKYICCIYAVKHFYYNVAWIYYRAAAILVCYSEEGVILISVSEKVRIGGDQGKGGGKQS